MKKKFFVLFLILFMTGCATGPKVAWEPYTAERFDAALKSGKPVLVDFYAAWCGPCMIMKETTFRDQRVIEALDPFIRLKADMSFRESKQVREASVRHHVMSLPTVVLFSREGREVARLSFVRAEELLAAIKQYHAELGVPETPVPLPPKPK